MEGGGGGGICGHQWQKLHLAPKSINISEQGVKKHYKISTPTRPKDKLHQRQRVVKELAHEFAPIFTRSLVQAVVPSHWLKVKVHVSSWY